MHRKLTITIDDEVYTAACRRVDPPLLSSRRLRASRGSRAGINRNENRCKGLHQRVGRGHISQFIEGLVRPHVVESAGLEAQYREAAADEAAESEALEWIEWSPDEALD